PMDLRPIQGSVQNPCASNDRGRRHQIRSLESGSVEPSPSRAAERRRLREEVAIRKRKTSILAGTLGLALVFAGGIGVIVSPPSRYEVTGLPCRAEATSTTPAAANTPRWYASSPLSIRMCFAISWNGTPGES